MIRIKQLYKIATGLIITVCLSAQSEQVLNTFNGPTPDDPFAAYHQDALQLEHARDEMNRQDNDLDVVLDGLNETKINSMNSRQLKKLALKLWVERKEYNLAEKKFEKEREELQETQRQMREKYSAAYEQKMDEAFAETRGPVVHPQRKDGGDGRLDDRELGESLEENQYKVINLTKKDIRIGIFSCLYSSMWGVSHTYCDDDMFSRYPHRDFHLREMISTAQPYGRNVVSVTLPKDPVRIKDLDAFGGRKAVNYFTLAKAERRYWPNDYDTLGAWVYFTAFDPSDKCKTEHKGAETFKGQPLYSGKWPATWGTNREGWLSPLRQDNPRILVVRSGHDECSFEIEGY